MHAEKVINLKELCMYYLFIHVYTHKRKGPQRNNNPVAYYIVLIKGYIWDLGKNSIAIFSYNFTDENCS